MILLALLRRPIRSYSQCRYRHCIDDATRALPFAAFDFSESTTAFLPVLKSALTRRGLPLRLYVDNGPNYRSHPAVESAINKLPHLGLDRVRAHGADGFVHSVALSILAANLHRIGLLVRRRMREAERRRGRRAAGARPSPAAFAPPAQHTETGTDFGVRKSKMWAGLMPSTLQWCRCGRFRGRNLAESVTVRRRFRVGVGVFWQTLVTTIALLLPRVHWQLNA